MSSLQSAFKLTFCLTLSLSSISLTSRNSLSSSRASFLGQISSSALYNSSPHLNTRRNRRAEIVVRAESDFYSILGVSRNASKSEIKSGKYTSYELYFTFLVDISAILVTFVLIGLLPLLPNQETIAVTVGNDWIFFLVLEDISNAFPREDRSLKLLNTMTTVPCRNILVPQFGLQPQVILRSASPGVKICFSYTALTLQTGISLTSRNSLSSSRASFLGQISSSALYNSSPHLNTRRNRRAEIVVRAESDFYSILGVSRNASKSEIKSGKYTSYELYFTFLVDISAILVTFVLIGLLPLLPNPYRKLARSYHPDVNNICLPSLLLGKAIFRGRLSSPKPYPVVLLLVLYVSENQEQSKSLRRLVMHMSSILQVLADNEKKSLYDKYGEAGLKGADMGMGDFNNPFDLFESLFEGMGGMGGTRGARNRPMQGDDEGYNLVLNFKDAIFGVEKDIEVTRLESCGTCNGSGAKPGTKTRKCRTCGGQGQVVSSARTPLGVFQQVMTCSTCDGTGEYSTPCSTCNGDGCVRKTKKISLKVPPGVDSGSRLRVRSEGNAGRRGGPPGDLYVFIEVRSDPVLKREGTNILYDCKVSYIDAILGTTMNVPTVDGSIDLKIPAGTQPGSTLVMAKKGVPYLGKRNNRGDQLVRVQVEIPKRLSSEERKLIEELADLNKSKTANSRR
ncbi:hypothetical protein ZIOFF_058170 [Zingiber officinale]|uniref:CR-type domain-containing protein n=1 Tax=Zingiber officinale TaxID=94328 RepID=A0A8J5FAN8_ZINOF|nr:hypothetical protein ZIOFF_058170 [Zingiber officinale]